MVFFIVRLTEDGKLSYCPSKGYFSDWLPNAYGAYPFTKISDAEALIAKRYKRWTRNQGYYDDKRNWVTYKCAPSLFIVRAKIDITVFDKELI